MRKWIALIALCLLPAMVQAQIDQPWLAEQAKLSVFSTVANIVRGPHYGEWWTDAGVAYRAYSFGDPSTKGPYASILILTRVVQIGDPTNTNLVISAAWREPLWFSDRFSVIFEVGAGNKLAIDGGEHREWGRIVSMAINCQIAKYSTFFVGGKIFDATAGQLNSAALGFGASINAGELLGEMVPKKD